jgi:TPR repeat protein
MNGMNAAFFHAIRNVVFGAIAALIVAGCAHPEPETTVLSSVTADSDRTKIEQALGEPVGQRQLGDNTVSVYSYEKGYVSRQRVAETGEHILGGVGKGALFGAAAGIEMLGQGSCDGAFCGVVVLIVPVLAVGGAVVGGVVAAVDSDESDRTRTTRELQRGNLAIVYSDSGAVKYISELSNATAPINAELDDLLSIYALANTGDADAIYQLGRKAFLRQHELGLLKESAKAGHAEAAYELGRAYQHGTGFAQNDELAFDWFMKAAQLEHAPAYLPVANAYRLGKGATENKSEAERWLNKAAAEGSTEAQRTLSQLRQDDEKARFQALLQRAEAGQHEFQIKVAEGYRYGTLTTKDVQLAIHWYARAAAGGDDFAPYALGRIYEEGETSTAHPSLAYIWYGVAERVSADSAEDLQIRRERLKGSISPGDIAWADHIVKQWPNQIDVRGGTGDPFAPLLKDSPSEQAQQRAETEKAARAARLLSEWQARADILRKEIAKSHPETFGGFFQIKEFEVVGAAVDNQNEGIVRLSTRYTISAPEGARNLPEPSNYRRIIIVNDPQQKVVDLQKATEAG